MKFLLIISILFSSSLLVQGQLEPILIRQVNIVDVETGHILQAKDVLVEGNRIKKISPKISGVRGAATIDGKDKYLIPGLIDFDAMITNRESHHEPGLTLMLAYGVTTVRDRAPVNPITYGVTLKHEIENGQRIGPRLWLISPFIGTNARSANKVNITKPEEAIAVVDSLVTSTDVIRADNSLSVEFLQAVVTRANHYRKPVVSRITYPFIDAAEAGLHMIDHASELRRNTSVNRQLFFDFSKRVTSGNATREEQYNQVLPELGGTDTSYFLQTIETMKRHHTWLCIGPSSYMPSVIRFELDDSSRHRFKSARQLKIMQKTREDYNKVINQERYKSFVDLKEIKWAYDLGLNMVIGSAMGELHTPGLGMHDAFYWLKQNGFTPLSILQMATLNPATFMNKQNELGSVRVGWLADLVLLEANPLLDIENAKKINAVIANGSLFQRKDLDRLLEEAKGKPSH